MSESFTKLSFSSDNKKDNISSDGHLGSREYMQEPLDSKRTPVDQDSHHVQAPTETFSTASPSSQPEVVSNTKLQMTNTNSPSATLSTSSLESSTDEDRLIQDINTVLQNLDKCLEDTDNMEYFRAEGFLDDARSNAEYLVRSLRAVIPYNYSSKYASPCWETDFQMSLKGSYVTGNVGDYRFSGDVGKLRYEPITVSTFRNQKHGMLKTSIACLPQVFILGIAKCGTSALYQLLASHPNIVWALHKEPRWWTGFAARIGKQTPEKVPEYLLTFSSTMGLSNYNGLTLDGSPTTFYEWPKYIEREGTRVPRDNFCLVPAVIPLVLPKSKHIVVMRDPVSLLYSSFWFDCAMRKRPPMSTLVQGPGIFHERAITKINTFNSCMKNSSLLFKCLYDIREQVLKDRSLSCGRVAINRAVYYIHAKRWLSAIPRDNFLFLTAEELSGNTDRVATMVWDFLGVPPSNNYIETLKRGRNWSMHAGQRIDYTTPRLRMRDDTEQLLRNFFRPFNEKLAILLGDQKFLWEKKTHDEPNHS